jgi:hypothetical protein
VFFLWWMFERFRVEQGLKVSFESLWCEAKRRDVPNMTLS